MKRIEALRTIIAWWLLFYAAGDPNEVDDAFERTLNLESFTMSTNLSNAIFIWFGTSHPSSKAQYHFIHVWTETIQDLKFKIPDLILGKVNLTEILTEVIL